MPFFMRHPLSKNIFKYLDVENEDDAGEEEGENNDYEFKKWCGFRRSTVLFLFYVISYCSYLIVGGYIMCILETETEQILKAETRKLKEEFLQKYPNINGKSIVKITFFEGLFYCYISLCSGCNVIDI